MAEMQQKTNKLNESSSDMSDNRILLFEITETYFIVIGWLL